MVNIRENTNKMSMDIFESTPLQGVDSIVLWMYLRSQSKHIFTKLVKNDIYIHYTYMQLLTTIKYWYVYSKLYLFFIKVILSTHTFYIY